MSEIQLFNYGEEKRPVRTVEIDGEVWFVAKDVCDILEIQNTTQAIQNLDEDERSMFYIGRQGEANIISEPGLYKLAFKSKKPEAKKFVRWVTHTVLPTIRQTGRFNVSETDSSEPSVDAGLQRVGLIIRAAEHKAVPQSEQLRLLSIAVKDLTGTELNVSARQECHATALTDLPEVFGVLKKGKTRNFGRGKGSVQFYCLLEIADALRISSILNISIY